MRLLPYALVACSLSVSCSDDFQATSAPIEDLVCQPLDLFAYETEDSCVTSGREADPCTTRDAAHSHTLIDASQSALTAHAFNDPSGGTYYGTAYRIFVVPGSPRRVSLQVDVAGLESRSEGKMQVRAGCFFEWSGAEMYNTLIPFVSREDRFALRYARNGTPPGDGVESLGQTVPDRALSVQLQLSVDSSVRFSSASGIVRESGQVLLNKAWTGQPAIASGTAQSFDPTKFRIFCGATVEDGDGSTMSVDVRLSGLRGEVCYAKARE